MLEIQPLPSPSGARTVEPVAPVSKPIDAGNGRPDQSTPTVEAGQSSERLPLTAVQPVLGLSTFRDEATGHLIVQIFHAGTGQVIAQIPSERQLDAYATPVSEGGSLNLDIDT